MDKFKQIIVVVPITGVLITFLVAYLFLTLSTIADEDESIFISVTDNSVEIKFSSASEPLAFYDLPKKLSLNVILGVSSNVSLPEKASKIVGTGSKELKSGSFQTERGVEYWFIKDQRHPILTINIVDEKYDRLVLEVENAHELAEQINSALN